MALAPYRETPTTEPVATPTPYQSFRTPTATAASYGGALGEAEQQAGRELSVTASHWGEIAADDASNNFQKQADHLLRGDPDKTTTNPDGTQTPDTGFMGLKGGEALRQRKTYENQLDDLLKKTRSGLYSEDQKLRFDNFSRRYRAVISSQMGTHADTQANVYAMGVAKSQATIGLNNVTANADNPALVQQYQHDVIDAYVKMAEQGGAKPGDPQWDAATADGKRAVAHAQITAIGVKDPSRAARMVDNYKGILGKDYAPLADHYRTRAEEEGGAATGQQIYGESSDAAPPATPGRLNEETTSVLGNIQSRLKDQGIDTQPSSTYRDPAHNAQVGGKQASRHTTGQAFDLPTVGKSQQQLEQMFDAIAGQAGVSQIGWEGDHFHVGTGQRGKGKIAFGPNKNDLAGAPDWFVQKVKAWQGTPAGGNATTPGGGTHLPEEEETKYQAWAKEQSAKRGFNVDTSDYDMRGYWKEHGQGATPQGDEHYPDTYKLPTHPTFSTDSKYSTAANPGGQWVETSNGQQMFIAGPANVANGIEKTKTYLANNDPNVQLVVPQGLQQSATSAPQGQQEAPAEDPPAVRAARRRAAAIEKIVQSDMAPRAKSAAIRTVNELATADQLKWAAEEKAQKDLANAGMDDYVKAMAPGQIVPPNIVQRITQDPRFNHAPHVRQQLLEIAKHQSGNDVQEATSAYGPGFWDLYKRASAAPGDPNKLSDPTELLRHAGPQGDITLQGMDRLQRVIAESHKSVDSHSVEQTKTSLMSYAKSKLSFEQDLGPIKIRDPKGEQIFSAQFVPKFLAAYDQWISKSGKDPWEFLTRENIDKIMTGMRDPKEMARDHLAAQGATLAPKPTVVPPPPPGANPDSWNTIIGQPPTYKDGRPVPIWAKDVTLLREHPTPDNVKKFDQVYGASGYSGQEILDSLGKPYGPQPPKPNVELERAQAARRTAPASPTANVQP